MSSSTHARGAVGGFGGVGGELGGSGGVGGGDGEVGGSGGVGGDGLNSMLTPPSRSFRANVSVTLISATRLE